MISILIPIYNGVEFIEESVSSVLRQNYENWELLIGVNGHPPNSKISAMPPSVNTYGAIRAPQYYNECASCDRIQPDILNAFRSNPYTHSLTTSV